MKEEDKRNILRSIKNELNVSGTNARLVQRKVTEDLGKNVSFYGMGYGRLLCAASTDIDYYYLYTDDTYGTIKAMSCASCYTVTDDIPCAIDTELVGSVERFCEKMGMVPFGGCLSATSE